MGMSCLSWRAICQDKTDTRTLVTLTGADWHVAPVGPAVSVTVGVSHAESKTIFISIGFFIIIIIIIIIIILTSWSLCCTWSGMQILCCSVPGCSDRCEAGPVQGRSPGLKVRWIINWPLWGYEIARLDRFFAPQETICLHCAKTKVDTSRNLMGPEQQKKLSSSKYHSSFPPPSCGLTSWNWL